MHTYARTFRAVVRKTSEELPHLTLSMKIFQCLGNVTMLLHLFSFSCFISGLMSYNVSTLLPKLAIQEQWMIGIEFSKIDPYTIIKVLHVFNAW